MARITIASLQKRIDDLERNDDRLSSENYKLKQEKEDRIRIVRERDNKTVEMLYEENRFLKHMIRVYAKDETLKSEPDIARNF